MTVLRSALVVFAGLAAVGFARRAHEPDYTVLDAHSEPLRAAFNADVGKVRILMLVAPT